jgi:hypothetical protein
MKIVFKYALPLLALYAILCVVGLFLSSSAGISLSLSDFVILTSLFSLFTFLQLFIFFRGQTREPESTAMHTLVSVSVKFLLELVLALIWFIVIKKTLVTSVIMFFVLYLTLTLFSTIVMLKTLKDKTLNKEVLV